MSSMVGQSSAGNNIPKGYKAGSIQQFTPEQMDLFKSLFGQVGSGSNLSRLASGDEAAFKPYEDQAMRGFQEFSGDLASRFSGAGMGARKGSGFKNLATQGAQDFASQLSLQRRDLQRQALADLLGLSETLLSQRPQENFLIKNQQKQSKLSKWLGIGLPIAGAAAGAAFGGPAGAALGGQLGGSLASGFGGSGGGNYEGISSLPSSWKGFGG
jgi:hypothetical protein